MISSSAPTAEIGLAVDLDAHFAVRRRVFVELQGLFSGSDRDGFDDEASTLHAVACVDGSVVGTVRLYPLGDGLWKGDRLAVLPDARVHRLGGELVQFAVRTAGSLGGSRMIAQVQVRQRALLRAPRAGRATARRRSTAASCTSRWR